MNNPSRIHPTINTNNQFIGEGVAQIQNDTPKINNKVNTSNNNINPPTIGVAAAGGAGNGNATGGNANNNNNNNANPNQPLINNRREDLMIDTNTNQNNMGNTNMQLSPTSNKSYLKISGYNLIETQKKSFLQAIDNIQNTRLVEVLGGLADIEEKRQAINTFGIAWKGLIDILNTMQENINLMTFENDIHYPNKDQYISDLIIESVKEIEGQYLDLIQTSSLRFLDTVCTVHDLQYKHLINIRYDIRSWKKSNIDHIKETQPTNRKLNSLSTSYDKDGQYNPSRNKSFFATICGCCISSDNAKDKNNNSGGVGGNTNMPRQSSQVKR